MVISITFILLTSFVEAMGFGEWLKDKDEKVRNTKIGSGMERSQAKIYKPRSF